MDNATANGPASGLLYASAVVAVLTIIYFSIPRRLLSSQVKGSAKGFSQESPEQDSPEQTKLCKALALALPDSVTLRQDGSAYTNSTNVYWAQQENETLPECIVRPKHVQQLCATVRILKREFESLGQHNAEAHAKGLFAVRSGGHSPVSGAASIEGGIVIDMSSFCDVTLSEDRSTVVIGTGAKWGKVSQVLDEKGLAVIGGRNAAVGVGGLTLGGTFVLQLERSDTGSYILAHRLQSLTVTL